ESLTTPDTDPVSPAKPGMACIATPRTNTAAALRIWAPCVWFAETVRPRSASRQDVLASIPMPQRRLHVGFVTSELAPYVKTGGLADVSAALPKALAKAGHKVTVFVPRYAAIPFPPGEFAG